MTRRQLLYGLAALAFAACRETRKDSVMAVLSGESTASPAGTSLIAHALAFSPSGDELAVARDDGVVSVFSSTSGNLLRTFAGGSSPVRSIAYSPNGRSLAAGSEDRYVRIWSTVDGALLHELQTGSPYPTEALLFHPDGRLICEVDLGLWDVSAGRRLAALAPSSGFSSIALSPNGALLAAGAGTSLRFWSLETGLELPPLAAHSVTPAGGTHAGIQAVAFSPDGQLLASGSEDNTVKLWRLPGRDLVTTLQHPAYDHRYDVQAVAFSPDGTRLAASDVSLKIWSAADWSLERELLIGDGTLLTTVVFSPDGRVLAAGNGGRGVELIQADTGRIMRTLTWHPTR